MSLGQVTEIMAMFCLGPLLARWRLKWIFVCGLSFGVLRFSLSAVGGKAWLLSGVALHGCSFALVLTMAQIYLDQRIEPGWRARAQALMTLMNSGFGNLIGYSRERLVVCEVHRPWRHALADLLGRIGRCRCSRADLFSNGLPGTYEKETGCSVDLWLPAPSAQPKICSASCRYQVRNAEPWLSGARPANELKSPIWRGFAPIFPCLGIGQAVEDRAVGIGQWNHHMVGSGGTRNGEPVVVKPTLMLLV
jgi:hypothetical protein